MKNPLLAIIALVALAGILFAQGPPSSTSAHSVVRQVELVGPIQVEGIVPLRNHITIPWNAMPGAQGGTPFTWTCPRGCTLAPLSSLVGVRGLGRINRFLWFSLGLLRMDRQTQSCTLEIL